MEVRRIAILDDYQHIFPELLDWSPVGDGPEVVYFDDTITDQDALVRRLETFDVIVANRERTPFPGDLLRRLPALKLLVSTGAHNSAIDLPAARELGIVVSGTTNGPGTQSTTELVWGLIFAVVRGIPREDADMRAGGWQAGIGRLLQGKTLGLVGLGRMGASMLPVARALGMRVVAWSRNMTDEQAAAEGVERVSREELFSGSDVVSVHIKFSDKSRGYVGADEIALMKPSAYLINTSRGPVVDLDALTKALESGAIAGAALDVYEVEPVPVDDPVRKLPNTVLSPHMGYVTRESFEDYAVGIVEAIAAYQKGAPIRLLEK